MKRFAFSQVGKTMALWMVCGFLSARGLYVTRTANHEKVS